MISTLALPAVLRSVERRLAGPVAVTRRNATAARHVEYWWVLFSGFFEPLLYLLSLGVGVGALLGDLRLADGRTVTYAAFVAPAMLAASAMQGALGEALNTVIKIRYIRMYDAALATPVTPVEIALGELLWAMLRCAAYSAVFLAVMVGMRLTSPLRALATFPATLVVGLAFSAAGLVLATFIRSTRAFDYVLGVQVALFLFSGTFSPVESLPAALRMVVAATPLHHAVELIRALATGAVGPAVLWHLAYLLALVVVSLAVLGRRVTALLYQMTAGRRPNDA